LNCVIILVSAGIQGCKRLLAPVSSGIYQHGAQPANEGRQTSSEVGGSSRIFFIEQIK
jgi:hypothetical protein